MCTHRVRVCKKGAEDTQFFRTWPGNERLFSYQCVYANICSFACNAMCGFVAVNAV